MTLRATVVVTSLAGGAGRTMLSKSLAATLARAGHSVAWVGADLAEGCHSEGADVSLRTCVEEPSSIVASSSLLRVAALDDEDARWMLQQPVAIWGSVLPRLAECYQVVVVDAPRLLQGEPLLAYANHLITLIALDRPPPATLSSVLELVVRVRKQTTSPLVLDGLVATRFDPMRTAAGRQLEATLALAPARAWLGLPIPEGASSARAGALDEFAAAWTKTIVEERSS